jgi:hypothetical protein
MNENETIVSNNKIDSKISNSSEELSFDCEIGENLKCGKVGHPLFPSILNEANSISLGYPIYQQIICDGTIIITCPANKIIHIYAAYHGIQQSTQTPCTFK